MNIIITRLMFGGIHVNKCITVTLQNSSYGLLRYIVVTA